MRIKDIAPLRKQIRNVHLVRNTAGEWEIYFFISDDATEEDRKTITKHYPSDQTRSWKSLDKAVSAAEEIFGKQLKTITINLRSK